jgi:hypothetical protein
VSGSIPVFVAFGFDSNQIVVFRFCHTTTTSIIHTKTNACCSQVPFLTGSIHDKGIYAST